MGAHHTPSIPPPPPPAYAPELVVAIYHSKKELVDMTNFGHLSYTQYYSNHRVRNGKNAPAHKLNHSSIES